MEAVLTSSDNKLPSVDGFFFFFGGGERGEQEMNQFLTKCFCSNYAEDLMSPYNQELVTWPAFIYVSQ